MVVKTLEVRTMEMLSLHKHILHEGSKDYQLVDVIEIDDTKKYTQKKLSPFINKHLLIKRIILDKQQQEFYCFEEHLTGSYYTEFYSSWDGYYKVKGYKVYKNNNQWTQ